MTLSHLKAEKKGEGERGREIKDKTNGKELLWELKTFEFPRTK